MWRPVLARLVDSTKTPIGTANPLAIAAPATLRAIATPTITAAQYASGNAVGGLLTFANIVRAAGRGGRLTAFIRDKAGQAGGYDLLLFDSAPTAPTDKTAVALSAADLAKCFGSLTPGTIVLGGTPGILNADTPKPFKLGSGTSIFGILVTRGTPTYASTSDISVELVNQPD